MGILFILDFEPPTQGAILNRPMVNFDPRCQIMGLVSLG